MKKSDWKGYTYDELTTRLLICRVKIESEREHLLRTIDSDKERVMSVVYEAQSYVDTAKNWWHNATAAVSYVNKIIRLFRNVKK